jgi:hypothetical protein
MKLKEQEWVVKPTNPHCPFVLITKQDNCTMKRARMGSKTHQSPLPVCTHRFDPVLESQLEGLVISG